MRIKLILLNIICIFLLLYFTALAWQHVVASTPFFDNDFKTFYISLNKNENSYKPHYYFRVDQITRQNRKMTIQSNQKLSSVNMNTPLMNVFLRLIIKIGSDLPNTVLLWMTLSLLGAGVSMAFFERRYLFPLLLLLWLSWPSLYNLKLGQVSYFILPILCAAFFLYQKQYERSAAILLALLASLKLFFVIFILLFIPKRQWHLLGLFIAPFLFFFFIPLLHFPWQDYRAFFQLAHNYSVFTTRAVLPMNGSLLGVVANVARFWHPASTDLQIRLCTIILCLYFLIRWIIYDCKKLIYLPEFSNELRFSFFIVLALICSPLGWEYYLLFLLIPIIVLIKISQRYALSSLFYLFFTAFLLLPYFAWMGLSAGVGNLVQSFAVFAGLVCFFIALCCGVKSARRALPARYNQVQLIVGMLSVCVLINVLLLLLNYGMPFFLDPSPKLYLQHAGAVMQVHHDNILY